MTRATAPRSKGSSLCSLATVATNLRVDGRDHLVPMAVEEPSVVAGLSHGAKLLRGGDGIVTTAIGSGEDVARSVLVQADGKIVVGGYSHNGGCWPGR